MVEQTIWWKLLEGSPKEWFTFTLGLVLLLVCIWMVSRIRTWFREDEDPSGSNHEMFLQMRELYRRGEINDAEFRSIRKRLLENGHLSLTDEASKSQQADEQSQD